MIGTFPPGNINLNKKIALTFFNVSLDLTLDQQGGVAMQTLVT